MIFLTGGGAFSQNLLILQPVIVQQYYSHFGAVFVIRI